MPKKTSPRDHRYMRAFPLMIANPTITQAQLAKDLGYQESTARYLLQAYHAAYEAFLRAGLHPPA